MVHTNLQPCSHSNILIDSKDLIDAYAMIQRMHDQCRIVRKTLFSHLHQHHGCINASSLEKPTQRLEMQGKIPFKYYDLCAQTGSSWIHNRLPSDDWQILTIILFNCFARPRGCNEHRTQRRFTVDNQLLTQKIYLDIFTDLRSDVSRIYNLAKEPYANQLN